MSRRSFTRKSGFRDSNLIIIASEGAETERIYFTSIKESYANPRIHIEVLHKTSSSSDPIHIIKQLDNFRAEYRIKTDDQLWLVIDVDRWGNQKLAQVSRLCGQKNYHLAVSNPAFEIWLILHINPLNFYNQSTKDEFLQNQKTGNRTRLERELVSLLGGYSKSNPDMDYFCRNIRTAIENARIADSHPETRWPNELGTRVYQLAVEIIE
jgi:hypothetical protein